MFYLTFIMLGRRQKLCTLRGRSQHLAGGVVIDNEVLEPFIASQGADK